MLYIFHIVFHNNICICKVFCFCILFSPVFSILVLLEIYQFVALMDELLEQNKDQNTNRTKSEHG